MEKSHTINHPDWVAERAYEIWGDSDGNKYWVIVNQPIESAAIDNQEVVESILGYSQQDNWVIETYRLATDYTVTKYYNGYYPVVINEPSTWFYNYQEYQNRVFSHYYLFDNPFKDSYFRGVKFQCAVSESAHENRAKFYKEAVSQHQAFSDATGCYFEDIQPNNFLANHDFSDIKIIDVCSIKLGDIKEFVCHATKEKWPLPDYRIVGPSIGDTFYRSRYHGGR